jgi:peroxiredoxin
MTGCGNRRAWAAATVLALVAAPSLLGCSSAQTGPANAGGKDGMLGSKAPELQVEPVSGDGPKSLAEAAGKVTIVDFWATYCEPCEKSFPRYQEMVDKNSGNLVVIGVSVDDPESKKPEDIKKFGEKTNVTFPLVWDKEGKTAGLYNPPKMPTSYVLDKSGIVRHIHAGYTPEEAGEIEKEIEALLK